LILFPGARAQFDFKQFRMAMSSTKPVPDASQLLRAWIREQHV